MFRCINSFTCQNLHSMLPCLTLHMFFLSSSSDLEVFFKQAAMAIPAEILSKVIEQTAKVVDEQVEAQLSKLNEMDDDDLERLKEKRLEALKKAQKQKQVSVRFSPPA